MTVANAVAPTPERTRDRSRRVTKRGAPVFFDLDRTLISQPTPLALATLSRRRGLPRTLSTGGSFTVSEIWESKEQHDKWFSENVEGTIPGIEQQVIKLRPVASLSCRSESIAFAQGGR